MKELAQDITAWLSLTLLVWALIQLGRHYA